MRFIYDISMTLMNAAIRLAAIFVPKVNQMRVGRKQTLAEVERWRVGVAGQNRPVVWVHCASLGEFEQGRPVIEQIKESSTDGALVVLTFFSPSGYNVRKDYAMADLVCYMPSDTRRNARRFVESVRPDTAIFVKYEFWFNFLDALHRFGAKTYLVSGIFRPDMSFFKWWGGFFRRMLRLIDRFFVQNEESARLLESIGLGERVVVAGDTRFDRVAKVVEAAPKLLLVEAFAKEAGTMVCGSTWPQDMEVLLPLMAEKDNMKFIVAPHEIDSEQIDAMMAKTGRKAVRYTQLSAMPDRQSALDSAAAASLMVIDCIGILSGVYGYGQLAYIGGGFGVGIHNILEAATWGMPVIFGPKYHKFAEAVEMVRRGGACSIASEEELKLAVERFTSVDSQAADIARRYVSENTGATQKFISVLFADLPDFKKRSTFEK